MGVALVAVLNNFMRQGRHFLTNTEDLTTQGSRTVELYKSPVNGFDMDYGIGSRTHECNVDTVDPRSQI